MSWYNGHEQVKCAVSIMFVLTCVQLFVYTVTKRFRCEVTSLEMLMMNDGIGT
jgi:hypothetical protein